MNLAAGLQAISAASWTHLSTWLKGQQGYHLAAPLASKARNSYRIRRTRASSVSLRYDTGHLLPAWELA